MSIVYICLDDDSFALRTALSLYQKLRNYNITIVIRMDRDSGLATVLKGEGPVFKRLQDFGFLDRVLKPELLLRGTHEILARAIHEGYIRDEVAKGETKASNPSIVPWDELPESLKDSNRRHADYLAVKLARIGCFIAPMSGLNAEHINFTFEEIEIMAKMEHEHWKEEREKAGWKYTSGPKNSEKKLNPTLVPWEELPDIEKEKDRSPVRKMPKFLSGAGFQIYRSEKKK